MKAITENPFDRAIIDGVTQLLYIAKRAKSAEITISISADSVPTVSYKIEELPIVVEEGANDERN